ncbi:uncharacterized protein IL334_006002 [Kwoniella shivajii]|uniref:Uncharacterized protein n=1 Tax=Kwoniella shivajii TaxID=564305 RepID=A0ABZ1D6K7_9TREE|nr:hypothetical protein IL334_006002 [Kwoniella shivajii]
MRFATLLCALPLIGSVFAAPTPIKETAIATRDVDVFAIVTQLEADVKAAGSLNSLSVEAEVTACLEVVVVAFNKCGEALGIELGLDVDAYIAIGELAKRGEVTEEVAKILAGVIVEVNILVGAIASDVASIPVVAALLSQIDSALCLILKGVEAILAGVLTLVAGILVDLKCVLSPLLGGVLGLLDVLVGGLLSGLLGSVGGIVGGLLGGI